MSTSSALTLLRGMRWSSDVRGMRWSSSARSGRIAADLRLAVNQPRRSAAALADLLTGDLPPFTPRVSQSLA